MKNEQESQSEMTMMMTITKILVGKKSACISSDART